ncbi:ankyrin [Plakobranchus ocellatus]|uniref:Ankyrin n=1 Tax=Plakobranchus ocellatus TaxID=259542 RepID=A0AAV3YJZ9_9GAST|nr:ankyrin [Plakobranchus ocellatus]
MLFSSLPPRDLGEELLAALQNEDLPEVDRLLDLMRPIKDYRFSGPDFGKPLPEACRAGLESFVAKRIASGTNLDPQTCQKLLKPAIMSGSIESVEKLINRGADLNMPCSFGKPVLVVAIDSLAKPAVSTMATFLVQKGAKVNRCLGYYSPLLLASLKQPDVVPYLLKNSADVNEVGDDLGNTPLTAVLKCRSCYARYPNHYYAPGIDVIKTLLSGGADPNIPDHRGETALHMAADTEMTSLLIQAGADLEARNYCGRTPLLKAASRKRTDVINLLKTYGADMAADDNYGNSALHIILKQSSEPQEETLRLFASMCNHISMERMTPLMLAALRCDTKAVRILLELGADPNIVNCDDEGINTALSYVLDLSGTKYGNSVLACAEELIIHNSVTSLPICYWYFFNMIRCGLDRLVQLMVKHGMAPLCQNTWTIEQINRAMSTRLRDILGKLSPLAAALLWDKFKIAQYFTENWFLTPADIVGSLELRYLRSELERKSQADGLRFMDENLSQPMSLMKLSFVAVSAQLGGVAGREERVSKTPLPNILKDKLLFRCENFPMDLTDWEQRIEVDEEESFLDPYLVCGLSYESDGDY